MEKYLQLTDFQIAQVISEQVKKVNKQKKYNIKSLTSPERNEVICALQKKLDLTEKQANFLLDNYSRTDDVAQKLYSLEHPNEPTAFLNIVCIKHTIKKNLIPAVVIIALSLLCMAFFVVATVISGETNLLIMVALFGLMIIAMGCLALPTASALWLLKIDKNAQCLDAKGKIIKITPALNIIYGRRTRRNHYIYFLKIKIQIDGNVNTYIYPLINDHVTCDLMKVDKVTKQVNQDLADKTCTFAIEGQVITDIHPDIAKQIAVRYNKNQRRVV